MYYSIRGSTPSANPLRWGPRIGNNAGALHGVKVNAVNDYYAMTLLFQLEFPLLYLNNQPRQIRPYYPQAGR